MKFDKLFIYLVFVVVLIIFNIASVYQLFAEREMKKKVYSLLLESKSDYELIVDNNNDLVTILRMQISVEGEHLDNVAITNLPGENDMLKNLFSDEYKLVYFFPEKGCPSCYEPFLLKLLEMRDSIGKENIVLITDFNLRSLKSFWVDKDSEMFPFRLSRNWGIPQTEPAFAYAFLLNKDMVVRKIIITDKINVDFCSEYLNYIVSYFNNVDLNR